MWYCIVKKVKVLVPRSCLTQYNLMDRSPPGSSVHGILQERTLEWVVIPFSRDLPDSGIKPVCLMSPALAGGFFATSSTWEAPGYQVGQG